MKFQKNHYDSLKQCIKDRFPTIPEQHEGESETKYLWSIFWASGWSQKCRDHYNEGDYMDTHIQTAIKKAVNELKLQK